MGSVESQRMFLRPQKTELGRFSQALWGSRKKAGRRWTSYSIMDKSAGSYCVDQPRFFGPLLTDTSETHRTVSGNTSASLPNTLASSYNKPGWQWLQCKNLRLQTNGWCQSAFTHCCNRKLDIFSTAPTANWNVGKKTKKLNKLLHKILFSLMYLH